MITPKVNGTKVVFGPCRLSYTHVFAKHNPNGDAADGKYQTNVLIPKTEKETIKACAKLSKQRSRPVSCPSGLAKSLRNWPCR